MNWNVKKKVKKKKKTFGTSNFKIIFIYPCKRKTNFFIEQSQNACNKNNEELI